MKLGQVTKIDKKNKAKSKQHYNDVMSENCDVIVIFPISGQFRANRKPDSGPIDFITPTSKRTPKKPIQIRVKCFIT